MRFYGFLEGNFRVIKIEQLQILMEAVMTTFIEDNNKVGMAVEKASSIAMMIFQGVSSGQPGIDRLDIARAFTMLIGIIKAIE